MNKKIMWMMLSGIMALSLVMTACGSAAEEEDGEVAEEEVVSADMPKYGGTISLVQVRDITVWDDIVTKTTTPGAVYGMTNEPLWAGDWALGNAGGYGKGVTDWATYYDRFEHKAGYLAESWEWTVDAANNMGTVVYQIRPGTSYALNAAPWAEAAQLVNGLGRQPKMSHNWNPRFNNVGYDVELSLTSLDLDGLSTGFQECVHRLHGQFHTSTVREERHIGNKEFVGCSPPNGAYVNCHHIEARINRCVKAVHDHGSAVSHKNCVHI